MNMKHNDVLEASAIKDDRKKQEMLSGAVSSTDSACSSIIHVKHQDQHPGFNVDYAEPKTHPPSHN